MYQDFENGIYAETSIIYCAHYFDPKICLKNNKLPYLMPGESIYLLDLTSIRYQNEGNYAIKVGIQCCAWISGGCDDGPYGTLQIQISQ